MNQSFEPFELERVACLTVENKIYPIHIGVNTIGRHRDAVVNIKNLTISQQHAVIVITDGIHFIADVKSSNGTTLSGSKLVAFKLYKLEHESELVLGDLKAIYYKHPDERIFDREAELSQVSTQSLYNANTQLIHDETVSNKENEDSSLDRFRVPLIPTPSTSKSDSKVESIHEAATQVVQWDIPEKSSSLDSTTDIHEAMNDENVSDKDDDKIQLNSESYGNYFDDSHYEIIHLPEVDKCTDIHEIETQVINLVECSTPHEISKESQTGNNTDKPNNTSQSSVAVHNLNIPVENGSSCTPPEISNNVQKEVGEVELASTLEENLVSASIKSPTQINVDDGNSNDSIDFMTLQKPSMSLVHINTETDRSNRDSQSTIILKSLNDNSDSQSSTSEDIVNKRRPVSKIESDSDTDIDEGKVNSKTPDSDQSGEIITKKRRSVPLPATQEVMADIEDKVEEIPIDDSSECESDVEDNRSKLIQGRTLEFIIEGTQEQDLPEDLNDTDCIPATQDVSLLTSKRLPASQKSTQKSSSEESFKLGLTEMMNDNTPSTEKLTNPSENNIVEENIQGIVRSLSTKNDSKSKSNKNHGKIRIDESDDDVTDIEDNEDEMKSSEIHLMLSGTSIEFNTVEDSQLIESAIEPPKKKSVPISSPSESGTDLEDTEFHLLPTQPIGERIEVNEESDIELKRKKHVLFNESDEFNNTKENGDIYLQPTQKIVKPARGSSNHKLDSSEKKKENDEVTDDDIYLQPTQKISDNINDTSDRPEDDDICDLPTQKLSDNDADTSKRNEDNIYVQATQRLEYEANLDEVDFKQGSSKKSPGSKTVVFVLPTEKVTDDNVTKESKVPLKENSKKYTFKKYSLNLDGSLSTILSNREESSKNPKEHEQIIESGSIDINFDSDEVKHHPEHKGRPSNPLAVILDEKKSESVSQINAFVHSNIEPCTSKDNGDVACETLSQIDAFVKSSDTFVKPTDSPTLRRQYRSPRKIVRKSNKPITFDELEDSLNKTAENLDIEVEKPEIPSTGKLVPVSPVHDSETISQIDAFIQAGTSKSGEEQNESITKLFDYDNLCLGDDIKSPVEFLKPSEPSPKRQKKEKIEINVNTHQVGSKLEETSDDIPETISQINRFIHSSDTESKINKESDDKHVDHETLSQIDAFIKSTDKWVDQEETTSGKKQKGRPRKNQIEKEKENPVPEKPSRGGRKTANNKSVYSTGLVQNEKDKNTSIIQRLQNNSFVSDAAKKANPLFILPSVSEESRIEYGRGKRNNKISCVPVSESNSGDGSDKREVVKPKRRVTKSRKLLSSSDESTSMAKEGLPEEINADVGASTLDSTVESSRSEINQSLALLEAKNRKTRKTLNDNVVAQEITLKVPKNRRSVSVSTLSESRMVSDIKPLVMLPAKTRRVSNRNAKEEATVEETVEITRLSRKRSNYVRQVKNSNEELCVASTSSAEDAPSRSKRKNLGPKSKPSARRKQTDEDSEDDRSSVASTEPSTPRKQRLLPNESLLLNSAERAKRKLKPKVVFTMLDNPSLETSIRSMGGSIVDSVEKSTVLVTEHVKRSQKLLSAVGQGKPICSPLWILHSKKNHEFLDPWDNILIDKEAETKWSFSLKESLERSSRKKLFDGYAFQILVTTAVDVLKGAIESSGGKLVSRHPGKGSTDKFFVISSPENKAKYMKLIKQHPGLKVIESEAIFDGVLRQELRFPKHYLS